MQPDFDARHGQFEGEMNSYFQLVGCAAAMFTGPFCLEPGSGGRLLTQSEVCGTRFRPSRINPVQPFSCPRERRLAAEIDLFGAPSAFHQHRRDRLRARRRPPNNPRSLRFSQLVDRFSISALIGGVNHEGHEPQNSSRFTGLT